MFFFIHNVLARGYAIVTYSENGQRVKSARDPQPDDHLTIQLHDGSVKTRVEYRGNV